MTEFTRTEPRPIFISYRREDSAYPAGWLFDRLSQHFGDRQIFKDVDSIDLGDDFVEDITTAVETCAVLLALIGSRWLTVTDEHGRRRLDNPDDFVRLEIEAALTRSVRVIPILVDGAQMPSARQLPATLVDLANRQAFEFSPSGFNSDTDRLLSALDRAVAEVPEGVPVPFEVSAVQLKDDGSIVLTVLVYGFDEGTPVEISGQAFQTNGATATFRFVQTLPPARAEQSVVLTVTAVSRRQFQAGEAITIFGAGQTTLLQPRRISGDSAGAHWRATTRYIGRIRPNALAYWTRWPGRRRRPQVDLRPGR